MEKTRREDSDLKKSHRDRDQTRNGERHRSCGEAS